MENRPPLSAFFNSPNAPVKELPKLNPSIGTNQIPAQQTTPQVQQGFMSKALSVGGNILKGIEQPFVSLAAAPVQALAKGLGQPDPYANKAFGGVDVSPVDKPLRKLGEAGEVASYLVPYGRFAKLGTLGNIAGGLAGGYGIDVSSNLAQGKNLEQATKPGLGTFLGGLIPSIGPIKNALGRAAGETVGVTTGTGYGVIKEAYNAAKEGGKRLESFSSALRGKVAPDQIVQEARDSLGTIIANRRNTYQEQLKNIATDTRSLDISPITKELGSQLDKFKIAVRNGSLDFSQSAIRFDKAAQADVQTIFDEMKNFGLQSGDRTAVGVDSLKQALGDLYSKSSNVRAFVTGVKHSARDVLKQVEGYDAMAKQYAESTDIISEIQKGLSLGDKAGVDTAFKKLTSALRINNDQRKEMIQELDQITGGELLPKIAGQQMSEILPRGIMRPLGGAIAGGAALSGAFLPLLKFAAFASPRMVGEMIGALGFTEKQVGQIVSAIGGLKSLQTGVNPLRQLQQSVPQELPQATPQQEQGGLNQRVPLEQFQSK